MKFSKYLNESSTINEAMTIKELREEIQKNIDYLNKIRRQGLETKKFEFASGQLSAFNEVLDLLKNFN